MCLLLQGITGVCLVTLQLATTHGGFPSPEWIKNITSWFWDLRIRCVFLPFCRKLGYPAVKLPKKHSHTLEKETSCLPAYLGIGPESLRVFPSFLILLSLEFQIYLLLPGCLFICSNRFQKLPSQGCLYIFHPLNHIMIYLCPTCM